MATKRKDPCDNFDVAFMPLAKKCAGEDEAAPDCRNSSSDASVDPPDFERPTLGQLMYYDRPCSARRSGQRCWLSVEMCLWNRVLHDLGFELLEHKPGKVILQSMPYAEAYNKHSTVCFVQSSCLLTRLLERHCCIDELKLFSRKLPSNADYTDNPNKKSYPVRLAAALRDGPIRNIRRLKLVLSNTPAENPDEVPKRHVYVFEGLNAVAGLEELVIDCPEINFKFSSELEALLRRNAGTLKRVKIVQATLPRNVYHALQYLVNCESLTFNPPLNIDRRLPTTDPVAQLLWKTNTLKKLSVRSIIDRAQLTPLAEAINTCTSLTELTVQFANTSCSMGALFSALGSNTTLKKLHVKEGVVTQRNEQALALALQYNTCLRTLEFEDCVFLESTTNWAGALMINTTLEELHMTLKLRVALVRQLCEALAVNKTLKRLTIASFDACMQVRVSLAECLAANSCYGRVQLPWSEPDIPGLTAVVVCPELCPEVVILPTISHISETSLMPLLQAIGVSERIHTFKICLGDAANAKGAAVCEMLKTTDYITAVEIGMGHDEGGQFHDLMHALAANRSITVATISVHAINRLETAEDLSYLLSHNTTLNGLALYSDSSFSAEFVRELSKGMWRNNHIVEFVIAPKLQCTDNESFILFETVRKNKSVLNRAVDFIFQHRTDRLCAEGFELFARSACQFAYIARVSGKTEAEVAAAVVSATNILKDYYLVITGVVQNSVRCHPANSTQIDALNSDCWRAIADYLSVYDVLCPIS
ncbi:uncharacterized protein [Dermacentor andersoni]|uniref:uncharacterized protein n=1 Tax=Dermacentor andersoni TaxID=34620 RepID=UPI002154FED5|nr:uncharacterized protein LOC126531515 [Dermacentor andersoni]